MFPQVGGVSLILLGIIATHCMLMLVAVAHKLCERCVCACLCVCASVRVCVCVSHAFMFCDVLCFYTDTILSKL